MKLRNFISENKLEGYESNIRIDIPIHEQEIHPETQKFLAMLYLNYWCKDDEEKAELNKVFSENEEIYQKELNQKYEVFKEESLSQENTVTSDETKSEESASNRFVQSNENQIVAYKENIIKKILNKVFGFFRRKEYGK